MLAGDRLALSRLFSILERAPDALSQVMRAVHPSTGSAYTIGITGPPGAGKSTLIDGLIPLLRREGHSVGVLAVDPTSPFTGGAVLGDRIRMQRHTLDERVFIRSLATRGVHGGLSSITGAAVRLLDAFGMDLVIVETVGVGQTELDIVTTADSVVVVLVPEAGDAVQALKAGLMEIADVFVINKSDREGAEKVAAAVGTEVRAARRGAWWTPTVLLSKADTGDGTAELWKAVSTHQSAATEQSRLEQRRRQRRRHEFEAALRESIEARLSHAGPDAVSVLAKVESGDVDPYSAASGVLSDSGLSSSTAAESGGADNTR